MLWRSASEFALVITTRTTWFGHHIAVCLPLMLWRSASEFPLVITTRTTSCGATSCQVCSVRCDVMWMQIVWGLCERASVRAVRVECRAPNRDETLGGQHIKTARPELSRRPAALNETFRPCKNYGPPANKAKTRYGCLRT